jgi:Zn-dependent protease
MTPLSDLLHSLYFLLRGAIDALLRRSRKRYVVATDIRAPVDLVWQVASAHDIKFAGPPPVELKAVRRPGPAEIYDATITVSGRQFSMAYRMEEEKPNERLLMELLPDGTDACARAGDEYFVSLDLAPRSDGTRMIISHDLTHKGFLGRVAVPLGAVHNARRLREHCETLAGTAASRPRSSPIGSAVMTAILTYASFTYLFDWTFAAILLVLLIVHEAGHALAMRWVGQPVAGIYFIPFLGGLAVGAAPHRNEAERGFVALMGPGFSLITTAAFMLAWQATGHPLLQSLALVSAILNVMNLAPVLPLDGGQVVDAMLSRSDPDMARVINFVALIGGVGVAVYFGWHLLTALLIATGLMLMARSGRARRIEPISIAGRSWLATGYIAAIAFYAAVLGVVSA